MSRYILLKVDDENIFIDYIRSNGIDKLGINDIIYGNEEEILKNFKKKNKKIVPKTDFDYSNFSVDEIKSIHEWFEYKAVMSSKNYKTIAGLKHLRNSFLKMSKNGTLINSINKALECTWSGVFEVKNIEENHGNNNCGSSQNYQRRYPKTSREHNSDVARTIFEDLYESQREFTEGFKYTIADKSES